MHIAFFVPGLPRPKGSTRAFIPKGWKRPIVTAANPAEKPWAAAISATASQHALNQVPEGAISLTLVFFLPRPKSLPKRVVNHLKDDSQVGFILAEKGYAMAGQATGMKVTVRWNDVRKEAPDGRDRDEANQGGDWGVANIRIYKFSETAIPGTPIAPVVGKLPTDEGSDAPS